MNHIMKIWRNVPLKAADGAKGEGEEEEEEEEEEEKEKGGDLELEDSLFLTASNREIGTCQSTKTFPFVLFVIVTLWKS